MDEDISNKIIIYDQKIIENGNLRRMVSRIIENGDPYNLFCEVEKEYENYLCPEIVDNLIYLLLPIAIRNGFDIISKVQVSETFLHNMNEILIPHLVMGDSRLKSIKVRAPYSDKIYSGNAVATAVTCGIDSTYTIMKYTSDNWKNIKLNQLVITNASVDLWDTIDSDLHGWISEHKSFFQRYENIAKETGLPLIKIFSNYIQHVCKKSKYKIPHLYVHNYITMANILALKKMFRIYYFSSTISYNKFTLNNNATEDTDRHELLSMHVLSTPGFLCFSSGISESRITKTKLLADYPLAQRYLHPCFTKQDANCSNPSCVKCLRALLTFDYYGKLDQMIHVFDISRYRKQRIEYLISLIKNKDHEYFIDLYEIFTKKNPLAIKEAMDKYISENMIHKDQYNDLFQAFTLANQYLVITDIESRFQKLLSKNNINTLCIIGDGTLGRKIVEIIKHHVQIFYWKDEQAKSCDASLNLCIPERYLVDAEHKIAKFNFPFNYTLFSLYDELDKIRT